MGWIRKWDGAAGAYRYVWKSRVSFLFAWYDLWIGFFWDRKSRKLYILPVPCIGMVIQFPEARKR